MIRILILIFLLAFVLTCSRSSSRSRSPRRVSSSFSPPARGRGQRAQQRGRGRGRGRRVNLSDSNDEASGSVRSPERKLSGKVVAKPGVALAKRLGRKVPASKVGSVLHKKRLVTFHKI